MNDFVYPPKPSPRAFGYLDGSGVEWAAYDTSQMEAYAREAAKQARALVAELVAADREYDEAWKEFVKVDENIDFEAPEWVVASDRVTDAEQRRAAALAAFGDIA